MQLVDMNSVTVCYIVKYNTLIPTRNNNIIFGIYVQNIIYHNRRWKITPELYISSVLKLGYTFY